MPTLLDQAGNPLLDQSGNPVLDQAGGASPVAAGFADQAGAADFISVTSTGSSLAMSDAGGAADTISVTQAAPALVPAAKVLPAATPAFIRSRMPVMHAQNLISGQWLHRDVQGVTSPQITWSLNAADSFSATITPPRSDLMSGGEPLLTEWRDAIYLEEDNEIKWGGLLTGSTFNGPQWALTCTGFSGFANGMIYEGVKYSQLKLEAMDAVRYLWNWLQNQGGTNLGLQMPATNTGFLLGNQYPSLPVSSVLAGAASYGDKTIKITQALITAPVAIDLPQAPWSAGMFLRVGGDSYVYKVKSADSGKLTLTSGLRDEHYAYKKDDVVVQVVYPTPYELDWWDSTDIGQEIESIRTEAVFDWREHHAWSDSSKSSVVHTWLVGAPRLGRYRTELRFCEGENITVAATVTRDGSAYAQRVVGTGSGQGSSTVRSTVTGSGGRLARSAVYTDQTVKTKARMTTIARRVQASMDNIDAVTQITVRNHASAPFGSFDPGDDIDVQLCTGWRNTTIKSRIISMTQDPTTDLMTLNLARSDSFSYLAESGQDGTA